MTGMPQSLTIVSTDIKFLRALIDFLDRYPTPGPGRTLIILHDNETSKELWEERKCESK